MIAIRRERHDARPGATTGGATVYAVGDVHGCYDLFHALLAEIRRDAAEREPERAPRVILCGDYIDRGPDSARVLDAVTWLLRSGTVDVTALDGNHEAMFRAFLDDPLAHTPWLRFGGRETLLSYGIVVPEQHDDPAAMIALRDRVLDVMPAAHDRTLRALALSVEIGDYAFVHAGVRPGVALADQVADDLLWIRGDFLDHPRPAAAVIVHGHSWIDERAAVLPHRVGLDTGAYETGVLTAVRIDDAGVEVIQAVKG
ncbi:metallophosphoesterase [Sphingomonas adhaesiva]|uniref:metallophosphoesterase n=1 Tax=Sphingomonas adhaesiva TaxID=28212 RepID=UPI002FFAA494